MKKAMLIILLLMSVNAYTQSYSYHKAQLHCHSTNSDGAMNPATMAQEYINRGYEIVCLTDHNYMTPANTYSQSGLVTINSEELTFDKHMNGWFLNHTIDATGYTPQQAIDSVRAQGGLIQFNHPVIAPSTTFPFYSDWSYTYSQFMALQNGPDMIEVHNAGTDLLGATFNMAIWDSLLMSNRKTWGTSTDDMHDLTTGYLIPTIDIGWVMIRLNTLSPDSVRAALLRGDFYGSNGVEISNYTVNGNTINISSTNATTIKFIGDWGQLLTEVTGSTATFTRTTQRYVRIELEKAGILGVGAKYAFTQPVFFDNTGVGNDNGFKPNLTSYPNPCNNKINICFNTEKKSDVIIEIYDITGKKITTVNKSIQQDGYNEIPVDVTKLNPGVFIYTININGLMTTNKFTKL